MLVYDYINLIQTMAQDDNIQFEEVITFINQAGRELKTNVSLTTNLIPKELPTDINYYIDVDGKWKPIEMKEFGIEDLFTTSISYYVVCLIQRSNFEIQESDISLQYALMNADKIAKKYDVDLTKSNTVINTVDFEDVVTTLSNFPGGGYG